MMMLVKVKGSIGTKSETRSNAIDSDLVKVHWEVQYFISENSTYMVQRFINFFSNVVKIVSACMVIPST